MSEDVNKVAESSTAAAVAEPEFNPADQYTWSPEQREHWNETGETPEPPKKQESAPAAKPAKEGESEPKGKSAAESETASRGKKERKPGEKLSAEERIAQLTGKVRELEERERSREAAPKPTTEEPKPATQAEAPKRPNPFTWKGTAEQFEAEMEKWEAHQRQQAVQEFQRNRAMQERDENLKRQLDEVTGKYPDAKGKIKATFDSFAKVQLPGVVYSMLDGSECLPEVMYVLSDESTLSNFIETATKNPGKAIRVLAQIEADILAKRSAPKPEEKSEPKSSEEPKPRAPRPPSEVGGRAAVGEDELRGAAASGDFRRFEAEQNRRKFARAT